MKTTLTNKYFVGNTPVKNFLFSDETRNISHAVLLYGESGLGKKTLGRYLSARLISRDEDFLNSNEGRMVLEQIHPDFLYLEKEGGIRVDDIRYLISQTNIKPNQADVRVCLLADCDNMTVSAQNALLKTLEEPPEGSRFILTARNKNALLETIQSRLESYKILPVGIKEGALYIEDSYKVKSKDALEAMEITSGNIGRALDHLEVTKKNKEEERAKKIVEAMSKGSRYRVAAELSSIKDRKEYSVVLDEVLLILSDIINYKSNIKDSGVFNMNSRHEKTAEGLSSKILVEAIEEIAKIKKVWVYNPNLQLLSSKLAIKLTNN